MASSLLFAKDVPITKEITVRIPKVGEVIENEEGYYNLVSKITASPNAYMVMLDDNGIDFTTLSHYDLFLMFGNVIFTSPECKLLFGDLDMSNCGAYVLQENDEPVLYDPKSDIVIKSTAYEMIADTVRQINLLEKDNKKPANNAAKMYLLETNRRRQRRHKNDKFKPYMESLVIALVNTPECKYNYEQVLDMSVYRFNQTYKQIKHKIDYDNLMNGVYSATVDTSKIEKSKLSFIQTQ